MKQSASMLSHAWGKLCWECLSVKSRESQRVRTLFRKRHDTISSWRISKNARDEAENICANTVAPGSTSFDSEYRPRFSSNGWPRRKRVLTADDMPSPVGREYVCKINSPGSRLVRVSEGGRVLELFMMCASRCDWITKGFEVLLWTSFAETLYGYNIILSQEKHSWLRWL